MRGFLFGINKFLEKVPFKAYDMLCSLGTEECGQSNGVEVVRRTFNEWSTCKSYQVFTRMQNLISRVFSVRLNEGNLEEVLKQLQDFRPDEFELKSFEDYDIWRLISMWIWACSIPMALSL